MKTEFIIPISVLAGMAFIFGLLKMIFSATQKKLKNYIQNHFSEEEILGATTGANFFGEMSKGGRQIRGNGALILTKDKIHFIRAVPFRKYEIPVESITKISLPNSFNGKSVFSRLLCLQYKTNSGLNAMAWAVKNPENWKKSIETLWKNAG